MLVATSLLPFSFSQRLRFVRVALRRPSPRLSHPLPCPREAVAVRCRRGCRRSRRRGAGTAPGASIGRPGLPLVTLLPHVGELFAHEYNHGVPGDLFVPAKYFLVAAWPRRACRLACRPPPGPPGFAIGNRGRFGVFNRFRSGQREPRGHGFPLVALLAHVLVHRPEIGQALFCELRPETEFSSGFRLLIGTVSGQKRCEFASK